MPERRVTEVLPSGSMAPAHPATLAVLGWKTSQGPRWAFPNRPPAYSGWQQWTDHPGEMGTLRPSLAMKQAHPVPSSWKHWRILGLAAAVEGQPRCPGHREHGVSSCSGPAVLCGGPTQGEGRSSECLQRSFARIRRRNTKSVLCSSKRFLGPPLLS